MKAIIALICLSLVCLNAARADDDDLLTKGQDEASKQWENTKEFGGQLSDGFMKGLTNVKEAAGSTWEDAKDVAGSAVDSTKELAGKAKDGLASAYDKTKEGLGNVVEGTKELGERTSEGIKETAQDAKDSIVKANEKLGKELQNSVDDMSGLANGIRSSFKVLAVASMFLILSNLH